MDLQPSAPEKTTCSAAEAMQPISAEKKCCIFYKLIVQSIIQEKELGIPNKFGRRFGDQLSDVVTLSDCNLATWKIGLRKLNNHRLWFHHGWPKFVEDHSIHSGCFLIFKYEGNSTFAVYIYDLAALEMKDSPDNTDASSDSARLKVLPSIRSPHSKDIFQTVKLPLPSKAQTCPKNNAVDIEDYADDFMNIMDETVDLTSQNQAPGCSKDKSFVDCLAERASSTVADRIERPTLEIIDKPVPEIAISVNADDLMETRKEALPNSIWKRRLISELDDFRDKKKARMEVCNKSSSLKWKRKPRAITYEQKRRAVLEAEKFKSDLPFCRVVMRPTYVYYSFTLCLPTDFSKKHLKDIRGVIMLQDSNGRKWPVRCCCEKYSNSKISTGWREFVVQNSLDDGDVCIFELVHREDIVLKVTIFRAAIPEEVGQVSGESVPQNISSMVVDNIPFEGHLGFEDYANDFMETRDELVELTSQNQAPVCSRDNNAFVADSIEKATLEKISVDADDVVETEEEEADLHFPHQASDIWKKWRLISELDDRLKAGLELHNVTSSNTGGSSESAQDKQMKVPSIRYPQSKDIFQTVKLPSSPSKAPKDKDFDIEDKVHDDVVETPNKLVDVTSQNQAPACSKDNAFVDCFAEKTSSSTIADTIDWPPLEMKKARTEVCNKASSLKWKRGPRTVTDEEKRQAALAAEKFESDLPFCLVVMRPSYVYSSFSLYFPRGFSKEHLKGIQGAITLQDSNGRKWHGRCSYRNSRAIITMGWRSFVVDNSLDDGDVCVFELVQKEEDIVLNVTIFRAANPEEVVH